MALPPDLLKILGPDVMALLQQMMSAPPDVTRTGAPSALPPAAPSIGPQMMPPESMPWQEQMSLLRPEDIMRGEMPLSWGDAMGAMKLVKSVPQFTKLSKIGQEILDFLLQQEKRYPGYGGSSFTSLHEITDSLPLPPDSDFPILAEAIETAFGRGKNQGMSGKQIIDYFNRETKNRLVHKQLDASDAAAGRLTRRPKLEGRDPKNEWTWKDLR